jgi:hypothetical protein
MRDTNLEWRKIPGRHSRVDVVRDIKTLKRVRYVFNRLLQVESILVVRTRPDSGSIQQLSKSVGSMERSSQNLGGPEKSTNLQYEALGPLHSSSLVGRTEPSCDAGLPAWIAIAG